MLQCLYSQCQTSHFGSALHHAISACSDPVLNTLGVEPPLIRYQSLRKRGTPTSKLASGHVSASAIHSIARRSVSVSAYQTLSVRPKRGIGRHTAATFTVPSPTKINPPASTSSNDPDRSLTSNPVNGV